MHVGFLAPDWPPEDSANGIVTYVAALRAGLMRAGHRVSVIATAGEPDIAQGVSVLPVVKPSLWTRVVTRVAAGASRSLAPPDFPAQLAAAVNALHARDRLDVFEMEESFGWFARVQALTDVPVVVKLHGPAFLSEQDGDYSSATARAKTRAEGDALRRAVAVVAPTLTTLRDTAAHYGLAPAVLAHVFNPIDTAIGGDFAWRSGEPSRDLVFVGRFDRRKGADRLIEVFTLIARARPDVRLIFVGPDKGLPGRDGSVLPIDAYLEREVEAGVRARIVSLGPQPKREVMRLRAQAAAVLVASRRESYGYAVAEALVQGCPVVAFDVPGVNELIRHEETGLLAPDGDIAAYADQVLRLIDGRAFAAGLGRAGRDSMCRDHSPDAVAASMVPIYQKAVADFAGRRSKKTAAA